MSNNEARETLLESAESSKDLYVRERFTHCLLHLSMMVNVILLIFSSILYYRSITISKKGDCLNSQIKQIEFYCRQSFLK